MISNKTLIVFAIIALASVSAITVKVDPKYAGGDPTSGTSNQCFCECTFSPDVCDCSCIYYENGEAKFSSKTEMTPDGVVPDGGDDGPDGKIIILINFFLPYF